MKTFTLIALMMPTMAFAGSNSDAQLAQKLQAQRQFDGGVSVRAVDKKYVDSAVAKLGGRATIEFSSKDQVSMGGVIVGSGADGLVSRSNSQAGAPVVVALPVIPRTSITVVGQVEEFKPSSYCAASLRIDAKGEVLQTLDFVQDSTDAESFKATLKFSGLAAKCARLGASLRLPPGKYVVTYNNTLSVVDLKSQENKVIPLREVRVPKYNGNTKFRIYRDFRSSLEVNKALYLIKSDADLGNYSDSFSQPSIIQAALSEVIPGILHRNKLPAMGSAFRYLWELQYTPYAKDGEMIQVLPGQYNIEWLIEGQTDYTTGIRVD